MAAAQYGGVISDKSFLRRDQWAFRMRFRRISTACLLALAAISSSAAQGRADEIRLDALKIPAIISGSRGPESVGLEAIVLRPDDGRPHPLAVLNHGSPRNPSDRSAMSPYSMWGQALAFARRGWVAVAFLRRGYGRSEGEWAETYGSCSNPDYAKAGRAGAEDIAAVAKFMATEPYVSKGKWISIGALRLAPSRRWRWRPTRRMISPPHSVLLPEGARQSRTRFAERSSSFRHSPDLARHRGYHCSGYPLKTIIFSGRG